MRRFRFRNDSCVLSESTRMSRGCLVLLFMLSTVMIGGQCSSLLCGRTTEVELTGRISSALALALLRPEGQTGPCTLRLTAPEATAFTLRLIDVKESVLEWDRALGVSSGRKWGGVAPAQDTAAPRAAPRPNNGTDSCKLLVYIDSSKNPIWRLPLCGSNAASVAARAGTKLLPPRIRIVWNPPTTPYHHTEKLRLVVTAVNSGAVCNNSSQFLCGTSGLCISTNLVCDGVRHCPSGEDEDAAACSQYREPPFLELLKRFAARNPELLGIDTVDQPTKPPSVISDLTVTVKITDTEQKPNTLVEFNAALKPYGPWGYLVIGMLICATVLMFCLAWECCCKRSKPSATPLNIPPACIDLSPTATITAAAQQMVLTEELPPTPPEYEPPPSYSSLFPRAFKSSPTPVPHCSHQEPPD